MSKKIRIALLIVAMWLSVSTPSALGQDTLEATVKTVMSELKENRPQVLWQVLPGSYQADISGLVQEFANQMQESLWDDIFATFSKVVRVLDEKKLFLLDYPMVSAQLSKSPNGEAAYDGMVALLETLISSDLFSLDQLRSFDGYRFLSTTGSQIMGQMSHLEALAPEETENLNKLRTMSVMLIWSEGDRAWVLVEIPDEEPQEVEFILVEGKWILAAMAEAWDTKIAEAREQLNLVAVYPQQMVQFRSVLAILDGGLESLLAAETSEQFQASLQGFIGLVSLAMISSMSTSASQGY